MVEVHQKNYWTQFLVMVKPARKIQRNQSSICSDEDERSTSFLNFESPHGGSQRDQKSSAHNLRIF